MQSQNSEENRVIDRSNSSPKEMSNKIQFEETLSLYLSKLKDLRENDQKDEEKIISTLKEIGIIQYKKGNFPEARKYYSEALEILETSKEPKKCDLLNIYCLLSEAFCKNSWWDKSLEYSNKAFNLTETELEKARVLNLLGRAYSGQKYHHKALTNLHQAEDILLKIESEESTEIMSHVYFNLASAYHLRSIPERAIEYYEHSLDLQKTVYGEYSPEYLLTRQLQALVKLQLGSTEEALKQSEETLSQRIKIYGEENHREVAESYSLICPIYAMIKDPKKSEEYLSKAKEIFEKTSGKNSDDYASTLQLTAILNLEGLEPSKLEGFFDEAYEIKKSIFGESHPVAVEVLEDKSKTLIDPEKPDITLFESILKHKIVFWGEKNSRVCETYVKLAESYIEDRKKYLEYIGKAVSSLMGAIEVDPFDAYESDGFIFLCILSLQDQEIMKLLAEDKDKFQEGKKQIQKDMDFTCFARGKLKHSLQIVNATMKSIGELCVLCGLI